VNALWSWMCPICFFRHGCGLGVGYGQLHRRSGEDVFFIWGLDDDEP
jgi:hypothetical protein